METLHKPRKSELLYILMCCCLLIGASLGICFYGSGIFSAPAAYGLQSTLGQVSLATTCFLIFMGAAALAVPLLMKKIHYRIILMAGSVMAVGASVLMSFSFSPVWLYICSSIQGVGAAMFGMVPVTIIINNWFYSRNSWALSLVTAFGAICGAVFTLLFGYCIEGLGWRMSFLIQAASIALLVAPSWLPRFASSPVLLHTMPYGNKEALEKSKPAPQPHSVQVLAVLLGLAVLTALLIGIPQHFTGYAVSIGLTLVAGASLFSWSMAGNIVFKLVNGLLSDMFNPLIGAVVLTFAVLVGSCGLLAGIWIGGEWALKTWSFLFGASYALSELSIPLLIRRFFGRFRYSGIYSFLNFASLVCTALSIAAVGFFFDASGNYIWIWAAALAVEAGIGVLLLCLYRTKEEAQKLEIPQKPAPVLAPSKSFQPISLDEEEKPEAKEEEPKVRVELSKEPIPPQSFESISFQSSNKKQPKEEGSEN